jgi:hypothetical protein
LDPNDAVRLRATVVLEDNTSGNAALDEAITFESRNEAIAKVTDKGVVLPVSSGETDIFTYSDSHQSGTSVKVLLGEKISKLTPVFWK